MRNPLARVASGSLLALASAAAALLAGCTVGPDFLRPAAPPVDGYTEEALPAETNSAKVPGGEAQHFVRDLDIPGQWWTLFHSAELDQLIERAFAANPNLGAAQAALRQARENVYAGEGAYFPTVTANGSATREKISGAAFGLPASSSSSPLGVTTAALNVSYNLDVFGGTRRQVESLQAQEDYQRYQLEATYLSLTSNLVVAAVNEASLRAQIAATEDVVALESDSLRVLQNQFELGGASKVAVLAQAATLAQTRATLPPLQKQLAQQRNQLAALTGGFPSQDHGQPFNLADLKLPQDLPVSLPSKLIEQRPDVRSAEAQLHVASANIGVAIANELPSFDITGSIGSTALGFGKMFSPGTGVWSLGGSVAQTLFDGGTLLHRKRAADAAFDQSSEQYRATVISAVQDVANALRALQADADAVNAQATAVQTASDSLAISRQQFQTGAITYLSLLTAQQTYQQARINLAVAQGNRYADTAALFQALGGGWWHRTDVAAKVDGPDRIALPIPTR
ncbi:MAG: NodT family efflux transporter outer rane factor lipoprotein [Rhodospirillales bacterium]|nr:NodT family efflux transporter outer rane factor lipoprotein [Rhodospirillales bacterium]